MPAAPSSAALPSAALSSKDALETIRRVKQDLGDFERMAEEMEFRHQRLLDFISTATDTLWEMNADLKLVKGLRVVSGPGQRATEEPIAPRLQALFVNKTPDEALAVEPGNDTRMAAHLEDLRAHRPFRGFEFHGIQSDGSPAWLESNGNPVFDEGGTFLGYRGTTRNITKRKEDEARIDFMARHDSLTSLPNRFLFQERLERALACMDPASGIAVLCLDLDRFKVINDTLGHQAGDLLLRGVAERLSNCLSAIDTVARLGADEFAIVQAATESPQDAADMARRLAEAIEAPFDIEGQSVSVRMTIGVALAPADGHTAEALMKHADIALTRAKTEESGSWRFFEPEMRARLDARRTLELDLRDGLARDEFEVYYQPLYNVVSREIVAFEALLRWRHPVRGMIPPDAFIPIAEENGMIVPIGEWVLRRACAEAMNWPEKVGVAVNLSPAQFRNRHLVGAVKEALASSGLAGTRLELEITEAVLMLKSDPILLALGELRGMGARIAMDDFGTGYSSLSYLRSFPFDKIKIDRSFVRDLAGTPAMNAMNKDAAVIVRAITSLGNSLNLGITAEGVETEAQLAILCTEGCTEAQGYLFSRPVPAQHLPALLRDERRISEKAFDDADVFSRDALSRFGWRRNAIADPLFRGTRDPVTKSA